MEFRYIECSSGYLWLENMLLVDCLCKHVILKPNGNSSKCIKYYEEAVKAGYDTVIWGTHSGFSKDPLENRNLQNARIKQMVADGFSSPIRIVLIDIGGIVYAWVDNLHTAIKDILVYGSDIPIGRLSYYIVDLCSFTPTVVDVGGSLRDSIKDIKGAIGCALKRKEYVNQGIINVGYTIGEFIKENNLTLNNVAPEVIDYYKLIYPLK